MFLNRIDRYIFRTVFSCFLIVVAIFCLLFFIFTYLAQVSNNIGHFSNWQLIVNTLLQMPGILYALLPICAMVGAIMGLSLLANNSEIIILRTSGCYSTTRIARGVILAGIIGSIIAVIFGGYIAPALQKMSKTRHANYNTDNIWLKNPSGFTHIANIDLGDKTDYGIRKFIVKNNEVKEIRYAAKAKYTTDKTAEVYKINKTTYPTKDSQKHIKIINNIKEDKWIDPIPLSIAKFITINDNSYLNLTQLFKFVLSNKDTNKDSLTLKFWQEIFQPISLMVLILISVPLSIGSTRSSMLIIKFLISALLGFFFFIVNQIFGPISLIMNLPPIIGAAAPTVIALILLIFLFIKAKET